MVDRWRRDVARRDRERRAAAEPASGGAAQEDDTLTVLFLCCHPVLTPTSAIALTLRAVGGPDDRGDRAGVPGAGGDHGAADQPRQAAGRGRAVLDARARRAPGPAAQRPARAVPDVQRGLHQQRRRRPHARRPVRRGDPDRAAPARGRGRRRGDRAARPHAPDGRAPAGADRRRRERRCRWPTRTGAGGTAPGSPRAPRCSTRRSDARRSASTSCRRRSPRSTTGRPTRGRDGLVADPRALRPARADDRQPGGDAQPGGRGGDGRRTGRRAGDPGRRGRRPPPRRPAARATCTSAPARPTWRSRTTGGRRAGRPTWRSAATWTRRWRGSS